MIRVNDILLIKKELWISQSFIISNLGYSESYFRRISYRKDIKSWEYEKVYGVYYYRYLTIPKRERLGDYKILELNAKEVEDEDCKAFENGFKESCIYSIKGEDIDFYKHIIRDRAKSKNFTEEDAKELAQAKTIIENITKALKQVNGYGISKQEFWEIVLKVSNELCPRFMKIKNVNGMRNKYTKMIEGDLRDNFIPKKLGNQFTRIVGKNKLVNIDTGEVYDFDLHEQLMYMIYANIGKMNKLFIGGDIGVYEFYKKRCEEDKIKPVSLSTVKGYINKNKYWLTLERDGKDEFNTRFVPYIPQEKPKYAGSIWVADWSGSKLLYYDRNTKQVKTLYTLRIVDVATGRVMGWSLGKKGEKGEKAEYMIPALKMAVANNGGYGCYEFKTDNGGGFTTDEARSYIKTICIKHTTIGIGNKQSNKADIL